MITKLSKSPKISEFHEKLQKQSGDAVKIGSISGVSGIAGAAIAASMIPVIGIGIGVIIGAVGAGLSAGSLKWKLDGEKKIELFKEFIDKLEASPGDPENKKLFTNLQETLNLDGPLLEELKGILQQEESHENRALSMEVVSSRESAPKKAFHRNSFQSEDEIEGNESV